MKEKSIRLTVGVAFVSALLLSTGQVSFAQGVGATPDSEEQNFLNLVNALRAQYGVSPVRISSTLESDAHWMSADMAANNYYGETDSLGRGPGARLASFGFTSNWNDNIAEGHPDAQSVYSDWLMFCNAGTNCVHGYVNLMLSGSYQLIGIGRAYNANSQYGWYWNIVFGAVSTAPPTAPMLLSAVAKGSTEVDLVWTASTGPNGVAGYQITRTGAVLTNAPGNATSYADTAVAPNSVYNYTIRAYDSAGSYSNASNMIQIYIPPSSAAIPLISSFTATPSNITAGQSSTLSWNTSGATSITIDNGVGSVSSASTKPVSPSSTTTYTLTATNAYGTATSRVTISVNTLPSTPTLTSAVAKGPTEVDLSWSASTNTTIAGYQISRNGAVTGTVSGSTLSYADLTVSPNTAYTYSVKAYDTSGNYSGASNAISVTTPAPPPSLPVISSFTVSPAVVASGQTATLSWTTLGATSISLDNGIGSVASTGSQSVIPAVTTTYTLTATNGAGTTTAKATVTVNVNTGPTTPTLLSAVASGPTLVNLAWTASTAAAGIAGYQITRSGSTAITLSSNSLYFTDVLAAPNTTYTYFIRAYDSAGNYSNGSNSIQLTTPISTTSVPCLGPSVNAFTACYYNNINLSGYPVFMRADAQINFNWGSGSPNPTVQAGNFSVKWQGTFSFVQGSYTFKATTSDGMRVYVDGNVVIDQWHDQTVASYTASQNLTQGNHLISVEYYEHSNTAIASLSWTKN